MILINLMTGTIFSLVANYRIERSERRNYLLTLQESLRIDTLTAHNHALARLSTIDPLTGLHNRRHLEERMPALEAEIAHGQCVSVVVIDVDHFKAFNDRYGHPAGDGCLVRLAALLRAGCEPSAIVVRLGGEEFAVILPGHASADALARAERLRLNLLSLAIPHESRTDGQCEITVSQGIAGTDHLGALSIPALIEAADVALYAAKHLGRNRVVVASRSSQAGAGTEKTSALHAA